jgi:hypothetical protein
MYGPGTRDGVRSETVVGRCLHNANRAIIFEGRVIRLSDTTVASQTELGEIH